MSEDAREALVEQAKLLEDEADDPGLMSPAYGRYVAALRAGAQALREAADRLAAPVGWQQALREWVPREDREKAYDNATECGCSLRKHQCYELHQEARRLLKLEDRDTP